MTDSAPHAPAGARIDRAMVLAAGFGTRMRPLTDDRPKPLVRLCGKPLVDWAMAHLRAAGVSRFVVNAHYHADQIAAHFDGVPDVAVSREPEILDTGGGVAKALPLLGEAPFFVVNADAVWLDGVRPALDRLAEAWDPARMDALLLLQPAATIDDYTGAGDFHLDPTGRARRRTELEIAPYVFAGVQILSPRLFEAAPAGAFSLNRLYDAAEAEERLAGLVHDGEWYHVGTPAALDHAADVIERGHTRSNTR